MGSGSSKSSPQRADNAGEGSGSPRRSSSSCSTNAKKLSVVGDDRDDLIDSVLEYVNYKRIKTLSYCYASRLHATDTDLQWAISQATAAHAQHIHRNDAAAGQMKHGRKTWKTVRLYISSSFDDFMAEREIMANEVIPKLVEWCEERKLRFTDIDLKWGCPHDCDDAEQVWLALRELDRCFQENTLPFFLALSGERLGWIPDKKDVAPSLARYYGWIQNFSLFEMEIIHGAYRRKNPNALFMVRDAEFMEGLPDNKRSVYSTGNKNEAHRADVLHKKLIDQFPNDQVITYHVKASDDGLSLESLRGDAASFSSVVVDFFKRRIGEIYPSVDEDVDSIEMRDQSQKVFLEYKNKNAIGMEKPLAEIDDYVKGCGDSSSNIPLCVVGDSGAGKSTVMAQSIERIEHMIANNEVTKESNEMGAWKLFYHFVGCAPGSDDLAVLFQRLFDDLSINVADVKDDFDTIIQKARNILTSEDTPPIVIFIDAIDGIDADQQNLIGRWLPTNIASHIRLIVSTTNGQHSLKKIEEAKPLPHFVRLGDIDHNDRQGMVVRHLHNYGITLGDDVMMNILNKAESGNPMWLAMACDRIYADYHPQKLDSVISDIPESLNSIVQLSLDGIDGRADKDMCVAALSLVYTSRRGLLENELRLLLQIHAKTGNESTKMPSRLWASIFNTVAPFLQTASGIGDGRFVFKHECYRNAFGSRYLSSEGGADAHQEEAKQWHSLLSTYFCGVTDNKRKSEEFPFHLYCLEETVQLADCLSNWSIFNELFSFSNRGDLVKYWQRAGGYGEAAKCYQQQLDAMKQTGDVTQSELSDRMEKVVSFMSTIGQHEASLSLLKEMASLEESSLGKRPDQMADIYQLLAKCKSEIVKTMDDDNSLKLPMEKEVVEYCKRSLTFRKTLTGELNRSKHGRVEMLMAMHLGTVAEKEIIGSDTLRVEAHSAIDSATAAFTETKERGREAEALMVKALIDRKVDNNAEEKRLFESLAMCREAYGNGHALTATILRCIGIMYEEDKEDIATARKHFVEWHQILTELYGADHPKTVTAKEHLSLPKYDLPE